MGLLSMTEATNSLRNWALWLAIFGILLCFTPALVVGILLSVFGVIVLLSTPIIGRAESHMNESIDNGGNGCGSFVLALLSALLLITLAGFVAGIVALR